MPQALISHLSTPGALGLPNPTSVTSTVTDFLMGLQTANTNVVGGSTSAVSNAYAALLPTADLATTVFVSIPSYDFDLFVGGLIQAVNGQPLAGLVNAIGLPLVATPVLLGFAAGMETVVLLEPVITLLTGIKFPHP